LEWEWEGMGIDHVGMEGNGNVKKPFPIISSANLTYHISMLKQYFHRWDKPGIKYST